MAKSYKADLHGGNPYYDDFNEDKKFVRIMSRPGFPLQAREVTQLQTILQSQIERLGDHFFEDGAVVNGGEIVETSAVAVRLEKTTEYTLTELKSFVGKTVRNAGGVQAVIVAVSDKSETFSNDQYQILFVNYTTGSSFSANDTLTIEGTLPLVEVTIKNSGNADGSGVPPTDTVSNVVCVAPGIFYADGFLLKNDAGTIAASKASSTDTTVAYRDFTSPSSSIGFSINRELITSESDETLKDPSFGFYNFNSPGADRYKVDLTLTEIPFTGTGISFDTQDYFELVRIIQGQTTKEVRYTDYAIFEETLARRTYDESGHYTVSPFTVDPVTHSSAFGVDSDTQHAIKVSAGKAYVSGYEFERLTPSFYPIDRGLTTQLLRLVPIKTPLQNYVTVIRDSSFDSLTTGDGRRETFTKQKSAIIQRESGGVVTNIGTCNIRTIQETTDGEIRLYLFNIKMNSDSKFVNSTHIAVEDTDTTDTVQRYRIGNDTTDTILSGIGTPRQIFKAPIGSALQTTNRADLFSSFLVKQAYPFTLDATGKATITSTKKFLEGVAANHVIFYSSSTSGDGATMMNIGTDLELLVNNTDSVRSIQISTPSGSSVAPNGEGTIIASQLWESDARGTENNIRQKTITEQTENDLSAIDASGGTFDDIINLNFADAFEIISITDTSTPPRDVTDSFDLDPNQTTEAYFNSRLILKAGFTCSSDPNTNKTNISTVKYKRFSHSGDGPFTVDSYPTIDTDGLFTYDEIPIFNDPETGESYSLADAFDFRPIKTTNGFDNGSGSSQVVAFENGVDIPFVSYVHHLSRIDRLILGDARDFRIVKGIPAVDPKAPLTNENDMVLGEFIIPPFTSTPDDIKFRYIDNQRTTMTEINELEKSQQFDQYFSFINDLEQTALNRAQNFRSSRTVNTDGIFVDTFIGHNNSVTSKRDHNCSIDPESGELRPAFESAFLHMGLTGASLGSDTVKTTDNVYLMSSESEPYAVNPDASAVINANQFGVPDFLGTMTLTPSSDPYFSTVVKPKVLVNTIGEVDNWETGINAFQRGRTRGFGSQWRDWESLWFGSPKRNDVNIDHSSTGSEYTRPRTSSFVSRILSDKVTRKIGNKVVDLSVVPFMRPKTVSLSAKNLKPQTAHRVYFDGQLVVTNAGSSDKYGNLTTSFNIPSGTYLTGKKLVRVIDVASSSQSSDDVTTAQSSADAIFYAEGLLETKVGDVHSIRPEITRRKAANSDDVSADYLEANSKSNLSATFNSLTPLAQELVVDPSEFPDGITLKDITLFFSRVPARSENEIAKPPIKLSIRPMFNGAPHPYKVVPFSEVTINADDITLSKFDSTLENNNTGRFTFSTPVYLRPNKSYAICLSTNSPDYEIYMGVVGDFVLDGNGQQTSNLVSSPLRLGPMFLPLNNGSSYKTENQFFKVTVNRCDFSQSSNTDVVFKTNSVGTVPYHVLHTHSNSQITENTRGIYELTSAAFGGGSVVVPEIDMNTTLDSFTSKNVINSTNQLQIKASLQKDPKSAVCTMVDGDRLGVVAVEYMANNDDGAAVAEELQPTARLATNRSRYISRKVTLNDKADDIVVIVDGSFEGNSQIKVFIKAQGPDQLESNFDDNAYEELFPEGNADLPTRAVFDELKPAGSVGGVMRFTTNNLQPGLVSGDFTKYQIKIVLMGNDVNNTGNASQIPILNSVAAVPLRRISQDEIRRYTPPGTIMAWAGSSAPFGFVLCDGTSFNFVQQPEYKVLFDAIGYTYGGAGNSFNVPDLRDRTIVGKGTSTALNNAFGADEITLDQLQVPLPPHWHGTGQGLNFHSNNDFSMIVGNGSGPDGWGGVGNYLMTNSINGSGSGNALKNGSGVSRSYASGSEVNTRAMVTTWPIRPHPDEDAVHNHGDGSSTSRAMINPHRRNGLSLTFNLDAGLEPVDVRQKSRVLNYIIKI